MITESTVYWITRLDVIIGAGALLLTFSGIALLLLGLLLLMDDDGIMFGEKTRKSAARVLKISAVLAVLASLLLIFVPSAKQAAAIYIIPKIANSEFVQETIPAEVGELYELTKGYLKSQIEVK